MLSAPADLDTDVLARTLTRDWGIAVAAMSYLPVGSGSHHWAVTDPAGGGWFVTVDDLHARRLSVAGTGADALRRLRGALDAARGLRASGAGFVVAPLPTAGDEPVVRLDERYVAAVYPMVDGESFGRGPFTGDEHRAAALDMVAGVHAAPPAVRRRAAEDDFAIVHRDALEAALHGTGPDDCGPYAQAVAVLVADHAGGIRALLDRYDALAVSADRERAVLTHGEPHAGNTMRTATGWRLVDWETALVAPPERDLWHIGGDLGAYTAATGAEVLPAMLAMYRLRRDLSDLAVDVDRFRRPHTGDAGDEQTWQVLSGLVGAVTSGPVRGAPHRGGAA